MSVASSMTTVYHKNPKNEPVLHRLSSQVSVTHGLSSGPTPTRGGSRSCSSRRATTGTTRTTNHEYTLDQQTPCGRRLLSRLAPLLLFQDLCFFASAEPQNPHRTGTSQNPADAERSQVPLAPTATMIPTSSPIENAPHDRPFLIVVPGGGLHPDTLLPQPWTIARLDAAAELFRQHISSSVGGGTITAPPGRAATRLDEHEKSSTNNMTKNTFVIPLSLGTPHKPIPTHPVTKKSVTESGAAAAYLIEHHNLPPTQILEDAASLDTIGNAFFAWTTHLQFFVESSGPRTGSGWSPGAGSALIPVAPEVVVITSKFHIPRTLAIFKHVLGLGLADRLGVSNDNEVMESLVENSLESPPSFDAMMARTEVGVPIPAPVKMRVPFAFLQAESNKCAKDEDFPPLSSAGVGGTNALGSGTSGVDHVATGGTPAKDGEGVDVVEDHSIVVFPLSFLPTVDVGMTPEQLSIRTEKEGTAYSKFITKTRAQLRSLRSVHQFLFTDHKAYASSRHVADGAGADDHTMDKALQSTY